MGWFDSASKLTEKYGARLRPITLTILWLLLTAKAWGILPDKGWDSVIALIILVIVQDIWKHVAGASSLCPSIGLQTDLYAMLQSDIKARSGGSATFYHYSGMVLHPLISQLYERGYTIRLFVQDPDTALKMGSKGQSERIKAFEAEIKSELQGYTDHTRGKFALYSSKIPISVRGAKIDDDLLIIGFYVWQNKTSTLGNSVSSDDAMTIRGHDTLGIYLVNKDTPGFKAADSALSRNEVRLNATLLWEWPMKSVSSVATG